MRRVKTDVSRLSVAVALGMMALNSLEALSVGWEVSTGTKLSSASTVEKTVRVRLCPLAKLTAAKLPAAKLTAAKLTSAKLTAAKLTAAATKLTCRGGLRLLPETAKAAQRRLTLP
jgi:hypothetical protein